MAKKRRLRANEVEQIQPIVKAAYDLGFHDGREAKNTTNSQSHTKALEGLQQQD